MCTLVLVLQEIPELVVEVSPSFFDIGKVRVGAEFLSFQNDRCHPTLGEETGRYKRPQSWRVD